MTEQKEQTTLEQRRKFWIDLDLNAFDELCIEKKLRSGDPPGPRDKCYNDAVRMYKYVRDQAAGPSYFMTEYLKDLEELRYARVVVSADTFLRGRKQGLVAASPGRSYLADFLEFSRKEAWTGFNKLVPAVENFRAMLDSALLEEEDVFFEEARSLATTALLRETFDNADQGKVLHEFNATYWEAVQESLSRIRGDKAFKVRMILLSRDMPEYLQNLTENSGASTSSGSCTRPGTLSARLRSLRSRADSSQSLTLSIRTR
jgi:hypothetical protein